MKSGYTDGESNDGPRNMGPVGPKVEQHCDEYAKKAAARDEVKKAWFRFEMMRMVCVIFVACTSIFLKDETMPTRPLPSQYTQLGELANQRKNTTTNNNNSNKNITTLLTVPYYVYDSLIWENMTFAGESLKEILASRPLRQSEDYWFMQSALNHPMRTLDPEQAQLFVVPALMNFAFDGVFISKGLEPRSGACNGDLCNDELIEFVEVILSASPYYLRNKGKDHIMVLSNWYSSKHPQVLESGIFRTLNLIQYENRLLTPNRTTLPTTFVGTPCPLEDKTNDFALIGSRAKNGVFKKGTGREDSVLQKTEKHKSHLEICDWLRGSRYNTSVCGPGPRCPALARSRYAFHFRGDRLLDILLSGTVPIFTSEAQYSVLPRWIDWKLLSVQVNVTSHDQFSKGVDAILNDTSYVQKQRQVLANRGLLDWRTGVAFDVYMFMFQRDLLPETVSGKKLYNPYNFPALIIDTTS